VSALSTFGLQANYTLIFELLLHYWVLLLHYWVSAAGTVCMVMHVPS